MTTADRRPGGLTALAIVNLVFAVLGMLGGLALSAINDDSDELARQADAMDRQADRLGEDPRRGDPALNRALVHGLAQQLRTPSPMAFRLMFASGMLGGVLLLVSSFGMLGQRRLLGRHAATAAGVSLIACGVIAVSKLGFMFWGIPVLGAAYAFVLLPLVLFAYRHALQR
ncbi:MAG: hypothetical protein NT062_30430 [Proteobacteria bacterium]|nr:hypothetical protein [Pseudomonadota bacterium]